MPFRNSDRTSLGFELFMQIPGQSVYTKVPNIGDIGIDAPSSPVESFKYADGQSSQYSGTSDPETVTLNMSFNPQTDEYDALVNAETSGDELQFYLQTGKESPPLFGNTNKFYVDTAGLVGFDATGTKPSFGRSATNPGKYGKGDCIKANNKYYRMVSLSGTPPNEALTVKDNPFVGPTNVETAIVQADAIVYTIVKPQLRVDFGATVSQAGSTSVSPSSPVPTDQIVLSVVTGIKGNWVIVPTA